MAPPFVALQCAGLAYTSRPESGVWAAKHLPRFQIARLALGLRLRFNPVRICAQVWELMQTWASSIELSQARAFLPQQSRKVSSRKHVDVER